jgi:hypothetical protein
MKAWHFVSDTLRDGRPVPADGEVLVHEGPLKLCASGLHASKNILDALHYAPGSTICRVEVCGEIIHGNDKLVASERTILWRVSGEQVLRKFARMCALDVMHLWDAPDIVVQYLKNGDESIRAAARDAAWDARAADAAAGLCGSGCGSGCGLGCSLGCNSGCGLGCGSGCGLGCGLGARDAADAAGSWDAAWAAALDATRDVAWDKQSRRLARRARAAA